MIIFQWNFIWNSNIYIKENAFEHVVWKMAAILSRRGRWVKPVMINSLRPSEGFMGPWPGLFLVLLMDCLFGDKPSSKKKKFYTHFKNSVFSYRRYIYIIQACGIRSVENHDDVTKWKHFPRYWPFVRGIHRSQVNSPHKSQWHGAMMFSWSGPEQTVEQTIEMLPSPNVCHSSILCFVTRLHCMVERERLQRPTRATCVLKSTQLQQRN